MKLFKIGKLKKAPTSCCSDQECCTTSRIMVLGACCQKSSDSFENVKTAVKEMGLDEVVTNIGDHTQIAKYGVMSTPALVIDEKVVSTGKLIEVETAKKLLEAAGFEAMAQCDCGNMCKVSDIEAASAAKKLAEEKGQSIKVLGPGCKKCNDLEAVTVEALKQLNMDATVDHVTDYVQIAAYGVMNTPGLVIDGKVVSTGKVLKTSEVVELLEKIRG